jgi:hypothetical protein
MLADEGHTRAGTENLGSTWVGATSPCRAVASADAALVAPTHSTGILAESYRAGTDGVPKPVQIAYPLETG